MKPENVLIDDDYVLAEGAAWFTVKDIFSVRIHTTDEGIVVDIYRNGHEDDDSIGSTYVFDWEGS